MLFERIRQRYGREKMPPAIAEGQRIYAIGDIHGRSDLLVELLNLISQHETTLTPARSQLIILGDMIDRGPHSAQILRALQHQQEASNLVVLRGNHEEILMDVEAGNAEAARAWVQYGGIATLQSFGVDIDRIDLDDPYAIIEEVRTHIPAAIIAWLRSLPLYHEFGDYFFVHAGVRPGIALQKQKPDDMLWIRDEFLNSKRHHGAVIVHGHSVDESGPHFGHNRIGIDTGAYRTGRLTALCVDGTNLLTLETAGPLAA